MGEAVVFLLVKENQVLLEFRKIDGVVEMHVPGGGIESFDVSKGAHYSVTAMHREIGEEFDGKVRINDFHYVGIVERKDKNIRFHTYIVTDWEGDIPSHTLENGIPDGELAWMALDEAINEAGALDVPVYALQKAKEFLEVERK